MNYIPSMESLHEMNRPKLSRTNVYSNVDEEQRQNMPRAATGKTRWSIGGGG